MGMEEEQRHREAPAPGTAAVVGQSSGCGEKEKRHSELSRFPDERVSEG